MITHEERGKVVGNPVEHSSEAIGSKGEELRRDDGRGGIGERHTVPEEKAARGEGGRAGSFVKYQRRRGNRRGQSRTANGLARVGKGEKRGSIGRRYTVRETVQREKKDQQGHEHLAKNARGEVSRPGQSGKYQGPR